MQRITALAGILLATGLVAQSPVPLPAYGSTFSGTAATRGFWFTCPVPCIVQGIAVPNEQNQPFQAVEFIDLGTTPPPSFSATTLGTQLFYNNSSAGGSIIPTNIVLQAGNVYGVLGLCTSVQGGGTGYNSYGTPAGAFTSNILGNPVTLTRFGTQSNIAANGGNQPVWQEPAGALSRVELHIVPAQGLYANFTATPTAGPVGMTANFTDGTFTSDPGGVTSWAWDLDGDSTIDSTAQNPSFTYNTCGAYNVTLTVTDASNPPSTVTKTGYIQVGITPITPNFTQTQIGPDTWQFTDTSSPTPATWAWDFNGDTVVDSTAQNPVWVYPTCTASASVTLTVTNSCSAPYTLTRSLTLLPPMVASFTYSSLGSGVFQFTDTSAPLPTSWAWDLDGDGITDSTAQNPVWAYTAPCTSVAVRLTAADNCSNSGTTTRPLILAPNQLTLSNIPNNGLSSANAGNLFDINVTNPNGITICAFNLYPFTAAAAVTANFYVCAEPGGFASNYNVAANWRLVATGTGASAGSYAVSNPFALSNPIYLPQGSYSMAIGTSVGLRYTTLTGNLVNAGPDFTVTAGRSAGPLFSAGIANRGFAGTIHYSVAGGGDVAGYGYFGAGCPGSLGISSLVANGTPRIGSTLNVTVNNLPANVAIMMTGFSKTNWLLGALPFDLAVYGAPNCKLRVSPDANLLLLGAGNSAVWPFTIPSNTGIIGLNLYNQAVVLNPGFNAAGAVGSDAAGMMVGL